MASPKWLVGIVLTALPSLVLADGYEFFLNGQPINARITSLAGTPKTPAPGDVAGVGQYDFVLDGPGRYKLRSAKSDSWRLFRVDDHGAETLIACKVGEEYLPYDRNASANGAPKKKFVNPLERADAATLAAVRGVRIEGWDDSIPAQLAKLNLPHCLVSFRPGHHSLAADEIPPGAQYLRIDEANGVDGPELKSFSALRFLEHEATRAHYDARGLQSLEHLQHLSLGVHQTGLENPEALGALTDLRDLELSSDRNPTDAAFLDPLKKLRRLSIARTQIHDLRALAGLPSIESVDARMSGVKQLPERAVPSLRELNLLAAEVPEAEVLAFKKLNPQCDVKHDWQAELQKALSGTDSVRVIAPDPMRGGDNRVLAEEKSPAAIAELTAAFAVDETTEPFHCMCDGSPWLEFRHGAKLLATISVQHGFGIRWGRGWPLDRTLIPRGQDAMCAWLAKHGAREPQLELGEKRERERAGARRLQMMTAILPPPVLDALRQAQSANEAAAAFTTHLADMAQRAIVCLRLFGADFGSWSNADSIDGLLKEELLPGIPAAKLAAVKLEPNLQAVNGLGRWLFFERKWSDWEADELERVLEVVAKDGLTHPREINRRKTIIALGQIGTTTAQKLLRAMLHGELPARPLRDDAGAEAGHQVTFTPEPKGLPAECSDSTHAAIWLARLGDTTSRPELQKLAGKLEGDERRSLERALAGEKD